MTDKELRERAEKLALELDAMTARIAEFRLSPVNEFKVAIFRELVAVRDQSRVKIKYSTRPPLEIPND